MRKLATPGISLSGIILTANIISVFHVNTFGGKTNQIYGTNFGSHETLGGTFRGHDVSTKYIGMNGCGRCMMAVRDKFRGWTEAQLKTPSTDLEEWRNSSPTYLEQLEGMGRND